MLTFRILPLALWAVRSNAFSGETLQFNTGPDMISMADAAANNILIPDVAANFSEWIEGAQQMGSFGLSPRQRQCVNPGYCKIPVQTVNDVAPKGTLAFQAAAVAVIPNNAAQANATIHPPKSAAAAVSPARKVRTALTVAAAKAVNRNVVLLDATIPRPQSVVGVRAYTVRRATIACPVADAVQLVRSAVETASATIPREQTVALDLVLSGLVKRARSVARMDFARALLQRNAVRTGHVRREQLVAKMNAVGQMATVHRMAIFTCVPMTATNDIGATLELDDGCVLHYEPPGATTTENNAARLRREVPTAPVIGNAGGLLARQASCTPSTTLTRTIWETETVTETGTRTVIVQGDEATFSCPEMEVTNDVGDTLALDGECVLSFSPAEPTSSVQEEAPTQGRPTANGQGPSVPVGPSTTASADDDSAGSVSEIRVFFMVGFVAVSMLWTAL
ncbi:hypothetical protein FPSE_02378 [Fusarium pseudograminearum CS3096]|uniref:Uncharacterized protein n=1 Tax=Fusarium pseudograminearum (strain CS3096) TaxID=1028729 RepID=K3W2E4_FUSPC|nr:hypothetical protein FPSE_02378 [Fusarium pseudograminearum CS3096]EKJ77505.1 hypothetical protein FPSE_02378 [Fusarium pseudograminearum CS3096]